jgi:hypothetical protein
MGKLIENFMKKIGVLIYTYNRVDDARINMEIIRNVWEKSKHFEDVEIVHAFNGKKKWYSKKYLENKLVAIKNSWHFQGAADLIDAGMRKFKEDVDYVIVLASDTWLIDPAYVKNLLEKMAKEKLYLATCSWGLPERNDLRDVGMAVDFFIVDLKWAKKYGMFPLNYGEFYKKYADLILYQSGGTVMFEKVVLTRFVKAVGREWGLSGSTRKRAFGKMLILKDREPVHSRIRKDGLWVRKMYWPKMGLLTHHDPLPKKKILKAEKITSGKNIEKLLEREDLSYYNNGIARAQYSNN